MLTCLNVDSIGQCIADIVEEMPNRARNEGDLTHGSSNLTMWAKTYRRNLFILTLGLLPHGSFEISGAGD